MTPIEAAAAATAKGYRALVVPNLNGPAGRAGGVYVVGPYVNKYLYADINGAIAEGDIDDLADTSGYMTPATSLRRG